VTDSPNHCSCRSGTRARHAIVCLLAGVRSLIADRPGVPRSLRLWAHVGRLAIAVLVAEHVAHRIAAALLDAGMASVVLPVAVGLASFGVLMTPVFVLWLWQRFRAWSSSRCKGGDQ